MRTSYKTPFLLSLITFFVISIFSSSCNNPKEELIVEENSDTLLHLPKTKFGIDTVKYQFYENIVKSNETFSDILGRQGISSKQIHEVVQAAKNVYDLRYIRQGKPYYTFQRKDSTNATDYLVYQITASKYIIFDLVDSITVANLELPIQTDTVMVKGIIESSLWVSMSNAGINPTLSLNLSDIYAWTIDFYGLQKGDEYQIIYEKQYIDAEYIGLGKVLSCKFNHASHDYLAYLFIQDSKEDYFDELGGSLRRAFLKAPLKFNRVSSKFSNSRLHPVLKIRRPHHGVDYAAATGTPVYTIGDGKVIAIGRSGGYGKRIEIKHNSTYTTGYAHLSRFAEGLKKGDFVKQGTLIGYVGSTGLATGPHLDFRVYKNGTAIDPLRMESPPSIPIHANKKLAYDSTMIFYDNLMKKLNI